MKRSELKKIIQEEIEKLTDGTFSIKGFDGEMDMTPHHVEMYYDRKTRFWIIQLQTKKGYQIGDAEYISGKKDAQKAKKDLEKKIKLKENVRVTFKNVEEFKTKKLIKIELASWKLVNQKWKKFNSDSKVLQKLRSSWEEEIESIQKDNNLKNWPYNHGDVIA